MKHIALFLLLTVPLQAQVFTHLPDLVAYAARHPEYPKADNTNWDDPDYSSFHRSLSTGFFYRSWLWLTGRGHSSWSPSLFVDQLKSVTQKRLDLRLAGRKIMHIRLTKPSEFIIFGDLHGGFHSLTRMLTDLKEHGIVDDNLTIIKNDCYLIFNGDAINRSPFTLETLSVILTLLEKNGDKVIYVRGKHEDKEHWLNFGLKRELKLRVGNGSFETENHIPLQKELTDFFNTLPLAVYVSNMNELENLIRISHRGRDDAEIDEDQTADFFTLPIQDTVTFYDITKRVPSKKEVDIKAIIKTEEWMQENRARSGLGLLDQNEGSTAWAVLSAPVPVHREFYNFYFDAYVTIKTADQIAQSSISLRHNDTHNEPKFVDAGTYNIVYATPYPDEKLTLSGKSISIGSSMSLIQGVPTLGKRTKRGLDVRINKENKIGGIHTNYLRSIIYNDNYMGYLARRIVEDLIAHSINVIFMPIGSPTLSAYLDMIQEKKALVLFPITGGPQFRKADLTHIIHMRASYVDEVNALMEYMIKEYGAKNFAFFYQDDAYGEPPLQTATAKLKEVGITKWVSVPYSRAETNFKAHAKKITSAQVDVIGLFSTANATQELIRQMGVESLANRKMFGISFLAEESFRHFTKNHGIDVLFSAVVPNPRLNPAPLVQEYREEMDKNNYPYDVSSLEAYIGTSLLCEIMKKMPLPITKEKLITAFESLQNFEFKGLQFSFDPEKRSLASAVWLERGDTQPWTQYDLQKNGAPTQVAKPDTMSSVITTTQQK